MPELPYQNTRCLDGQSVGNKKPFYFPLSWCLLIPTLGVFLGTFIMIRSGVAAQIWEQNIATLFLGIISWLFFRVRRCGLLRGGPVMFCSSYLVPVFLALSFFGTGMQGVHRWVSIGSVRIHVASIVLPAFLITFRRIVAARGALPLALSTAVLLALQPDASETSGFTAGIFVLLLRSRMNRVAAWLASFVFIASLSLAWVIRDPLPAVPYVEGVIALAARIHPLVAVASVISLAALPLPFLRPLSSASDAERDTVVALGLYFSVKLLLSAATQRFPIMVLGYGASPIIGYFIALIWIDSICRTRREKVSIDSRRRQ